MIINGIVYGYPVHMQQDPFVCDPPRRSPSGPAVWRSHGGLTASGQADGGATEPPAATESAPPAVRTASTATAPTAAQSDAERLDKLRGERTDHLVFLGALLSGVAIGLWIEGR